MSIAANTSSIRSRSNPRLDLLGTCRAFERLDDCHSSCKPVFLRYLSSQGYSWNLFNHVWCPLLTKRINTFNVYEYLKPSKSLPSPARSQAFCFPRTAKPHAFHPQLGMHASEAPDHCGLNARHKGEACVTPDVQVVHAQRSINIHVH